MQKECKDGEMERGEEGKSKENLSPSSGILFFIL